MKDQRGKKGGAFGEHLKGVIPNALWDAIKWLGGWVGRTVSGYVAGSGALGALIAALVAVLSRAAVWVTIGFLALAFVLGMLFGAWLVARRHRHPDAPAVPTASKTVEAREARLDSTAYPWGSNQRLEEDIEFVQLALVESPGYTGFVAPALGARRGFMQIGDTAFVSASDPNVQEYFMMVLPEMERRGLIEWVGHKRHAFRLTPVGAISGRNLKQEYVAVNKQAEYLWNRMQQFKQAPGADESGLTQFQRDILSGMYETMENRAYVSARFGDVMRLTAGVNLPTAGGHERSIGCGLSTGGPTDGQGHEEAEVHA